MNKAFGRLQMAATQPLTELDFYQHLSALLAEIRCTHTKAEQPPAFEEWRKTNPSHLPFRFRLIEGRMLVASASKDGALRRGDEIVEINGRSISSLVRALGAYVPIDGDTVWSRASTLANDGDLMGADFDHFYPFVFGLSNQFALQARTRDESKTSSFRKFQTELPAISFHDWLQLDTDGRPFRSNFSETTTWRMLDTNTGLLRVETFVNYRKPTNPQALLTKAMNELRSAGAQRLVVDLRENGGGSDDAALALLDHLALRPYTYQRAIRLKAVRYGDLPDFIKTWGDRDLLFNPPLEQFVRTTDGWFERRAEDARDVLQQRSPAPAAFLGEVTVLTSPVNASGATMLISKLRDEGRVRLVGGRCGGSGDGPTAGQIFNLVLPKSGITVRIPLAFNVMNVKRFDRSGGIRPDVLVEPTVADFWAGRDRTLETALSTWGRGSATQPTKIVQPAASPRDASR
jgi:C-terminal processing protease CtpA/Prc